MTAVAMLADRGLRADLDVVAPSGGVGWLAVVALLVLAANGAFWLLRARRRRGSRDGA